MPEKIEKLDDMSKEQKEALCYRLLVERDKINEALRIVQNSMKEELNDRPNPS